MELAGLSCAQALAKSYPNTTHKRVLVCCGPGNQVGSIAIAIPTVSSARRSSHFTQGGDGLVAARHLHHFRYTPTIYYPKPGGKDIYQRLLQQARNLGIPVVAGADEFDAAIAATDVVLDAIFGRRRRCIQTAPSDPHSTGFSFQPPVRAPFDRVLNALAATHAPIVSVDIPSGWNVEAGRQPLFTSPDAAGKSQTVETIDPAVLISLTAPKEGVQAYTGRHWLGGRFVPE